MKCKILFLALLILFSSSCRERRISGELREFMSNTVVMPSDLQKVYDRNIEMVSTDSLGVTMIILYDSLECSSCRINHLRDFLSGYELLDSIPGCKLLTVFSPRQEEYDEVVKQLMILNFPYPIYVDYSCSFRKLNPFIPDDTKFHSFLIDRDNRPVFVGNPLARREMMDLFNRVLYSMYPETLN